MLRYLRKNTAWIAAVKSVPKFLTGAPHAPKISLVRLADHSPSAYDDVKNNWRRIVEDLKNRISVKHARSSELRNKAIGWIDDHFQPELSKGLPFRVHAEAGLMALLRVAETLSQDTPNSVNDLFTVCGGP